MAEESLIGQCRVENDLLRASRPGKHGLDALATPGGVVVLTPVRDLKPSTVPTIDSYEAVWIEAYCSESAGEPVFCSSRRMLQPSDCCKALADWHIPRPRDCRRNHASHR